MKPCLVLPQNHIFEPPNEPPPPLSRASGGTRGQKNRFFGVALVLASLNPLVQRTLGAQLLRLRGLDAGAPLQEFVDHTTWRLHRHRREIDEVERQFTDVKERLAALQRDEKEIEGELARLRAQADKNQHDVGEQAAAQPLVDDGRGPADESSDP